MSPATTNPQRSGRPLDKLVAKLVVETRSTVTLLLLRRLPGRGVLVLHAAAVRQHERLGFVYTSLCSGSGPACRDAALPLHAIEYAISYRSCCGSTAPRPCEDVQIRVQPRRMLLLGVPSRQLRPRQQPPAAVVGGSRRRLAAGFRQRACPQTAAGCSCRLLRPLQADLQPRQWRRRFCGRWHRPRSRRICRLLHSWRGCDGRSCRRACGYARG